MKTIHGRMDFMQYDFHYCKKCESVEYTDENKCKKCNINYVFLSDYLKEL